MNHTTSSPAQSSVRNKTNSSRATEPHKDCAGHFKNLPLPSLNTTRYLRACAICLIMAGAAICPPSVFAATITWGNSGTDFNTGARWVGGLAPGTADVATFTGAEVTNPDLSANLTIQGLSFSSATTSGYALSSTNSSTLTLTSSNPLNASNTSGTNTISAALILAPGANTSRTITQSTGGTLNLSGDISSTNAIDAYTTFTGGGTINLSGTNTFNESGRIGNGKIVVAATTTLGITAGTTTINISPDGMAVGVDPGFNHEGIVTVSGGTLNLNAVPLTFSGARGGQFFFWILSPATLEH